MLPEPRPRAVLVQVRLCRRVRRWLEDRGLRFVTGTFDDPAAYDRIRETLKVDPYIPFEEAVNASMTETLARSINTSFVVVLTVLAMMLIGGDTIRNFLLVLLVGIISGTYSSIGLASQLLVAWERDDIGRWFRRMRGRPEGQVAEPA